MSVFERIQSGKSSNEVAHQIEALVIEGILCAREQLPAERDLAKETGVSRPVVRDALQLLVDRKILIRKQGGGTFVADIIGQVFSDPITELLGHHQKATIDYIEYRREIEGIAAGFAAERATAFDKDLLRKQVQKMSDAHVKQDSDLETKLDLEFHSLIGEMAHNLVLLHTLRSCYKLLSQGILKNRERLYDTDERQALFDQHIEIANAILEGNKERAIEASRYHLTYILEKHAVLAKELERERISNLRFKQRS